MELQPYQLLGAEGAAGTAGASGAAGSDGAEGAAGIDPVGGAGGAGGKAPVPGTGSVGMLGTVPEGVTVPKSLLVGAGDPAGRLGVVGAEGGTAEPLGGVIAEGVAIGAGAGGVMAGAGGAGGGGGGGGGGSSGAAAPSAPVGAKVFVSVASGDGAFSAFLQAKPPPASKAPIRSQTFNERFIKSPFRAEFQYGDYSVLIREDVKAVGGKVKQCQGFSQPKAGERPLFLLPGIPLHASDVLTKSYV